MSAWTIAVRTRINHTFIADAIAREVRYLPMEGARWGRPAPLPWPLRAFMKVVGPITPPEKRDRFAKFSGYVTITRRVEVPLDAKILRGNETSIIVADAEDERAISRDEIVDIDHPGNGAATAGGLLSVYGVLSIVVGAAVCEEVASSGCMGVFLPAVVGIALMTWGFIVWHGSTSAADQTWSQRSKRF